MFRRVTILLSSIFVAVWLLAITATAALESLPAKALHRFSVLSLYPFTSSHGASVRLDDLTYWRDIRPILQKNCTICHSPKNVAKREIGGGLSLASFDAVLKDLEEPVVVPGNSGDSKLFQLLIEKDEEKRMPKDTDPLAGSDIELIRKWIDGGAKEGERPATTAEATGDNKPKRPVSLVRLVDVVLPTALTLPAELSKSLEPPPAEPGQLELALKIGPLPPVTALAYGPDGKWLAVGTYRSIAIWDLTNAELLRSIDVAGAVHSFALGTDASGTTGRLAAAGGLPARSGEVLIFDIMSWQLVASLAEHTDVVYDVAFSPDSQKLATASLDKTVRIWAAPGWKSVHTIRGHSDFVYSVNFTPDGTRLISSSKDRSIKVYNAGSWESERTLSGHNEEVLTAAVSGDSYNVVSAGKEPQLRWWIVENGQNNRSMPGHSGSVNQIVFSRDGKRLASVGQDKQVRIWDGSDGKLLRSIAGSTEWLYAVALSPDARFVAAGSWDGVVRVWETETGRALGTLIAPPSPDVTKPQWIATTPEGFYHASHDLSELLQWRVGGRVVSSAILASTLRQAEPVRRSLRGEVVESPTFDAGK
jgi:WD40 repeat protein